jgi:hypothetical protein
MKNITLSADESLIEGDQPVPLRLCGQPSGMQVSAPSASLQEGRVSDQGL